MSTSLTLDEILSDFKRFADLFDDEELHVNSKSSFGDTPLHWMATLGDHIAIEILIQAGTYLNIKNSLGNTPLHNAVISRQASAVHALLVAGSDCLISNLSGKSALDMALEDGYHPVIDELISRDC